MLDPTSIVSQSNQRPPEWLRSRPCMSLENAGHISSTVQSSFLISAFCISPGSIYVYALRYTPCHYVEAHMRPILLVFRAHGQCMRYRPAVHLLTVYSFAFVLCGLVHIPHFVYVPYSAHQCSGEEFHATFRTVRNPVFLASYPCYIGIVDVNGLCTRVKLSAFVIHCFEYGLTPTCGCAPYTSAASCARALVPMGWSIHHICSAVFLLFFSFTHFCVTVHTSLQGKELHATFRTLHLATVPRHDTLLIAFDINLLME
eukprot:1253240-Amphidinium_carterae.1